MPARAAHRAACRLAPHLPAWTAFRRASNLIGLMRRAPAAQQMLAALSAAHSRQLGSPDETNTSSDANRLRVALSRLSSPFRRRGKGLLANAHANTCMHCTKQRNKHHAVVKIGTNCTCGTKRVRLNLTVVAACSSSREEEPSSGAWGVAPQI